LNFAHGDFMVLAMYGCLTAYTYFAIDPYLAMIITVPLMFAIGLLVYHYLIKRVLHAHFVMVLQLCLGLVFLISNTMHMAFKAEPVMVPTFISYDKIYLGPLAIKMPLVFAFVICAVVVVGLWWMLRTTDFGRFIRAISQDPVAAALMGIKVERVRGLVLAISFALLGVTASCGIPLFVLDPHIGLHLTLFGFIIITLGGLGNFMGALLGGLILGASQALGQVVLGGSLGLIFVYAIFILLLLVRPWGLLGERVEVTVR